MSKPTKKTALAWIHPGEILREEFLVPMGVSVYQLAKALQVPLPRVNDIVREKRSITAETAVRLAKYFGTSPQFWLNLQTQFDIRTAQKKLGKSLKGIKTREIA